MSDWNPTAQKRAVRDGYDQMGSEYDAQRGDDPDFLDDLRERVPAGGRILDAGCGAGRPVAALLAGEYDLVGLDISSEQVNMASKNAPDGRFVQGDMTRLPFDSEAFDGITAYHSVIHVPTDEHPAAASEFARVLRPGGHLLLTVGPNEWQGANDDWLDTGVEMRWTIPGPDESESMLESAGFEVVWRRTNENLPGDETWCFVLARKREGSDRR